MISDYYIHLMMWLSLQLKTEEVMSLNGHWSRLPVVHLTQYNLAKDINTH